MTNKSERWFGRAMRAIGSGLLWTAWIALGLLWAYLVFYWMFWKGGSWLVARIGNLDLSDPMTGRITGALIALVISTVGVVLTVLIRRWFQAQHLARSIELVEAHRSTLVKRKPNDIIPNAVFPEDLRELGKFLAPAVVLRVIATARVCQRVYELSENESRDTKDQIKRLVDTYLKNSSLSKVSNALNNPFAFSSKTKIFDLTENDLFNENLF